MTTTLFLLVDESLIEFILEMLLRQYFPSNRDEANAVIEEFINLWMSTLEQEVQLEKTVNAHTIWKPI